MCDKMAGHCFNDEERTRLKDKGWSAEQISFVDNSMVENKIKEFIK